MTSPGSDLDPRVIAHEPLDPAEDARGEHHLVPDGDLLAEPGAGAGGAGAGAG